MVDNIDYKIKYLKYKSKYIELKNKQMKGGMDAAAVQEPAPVPEPAPAAAEGSLKDNLVQTFIEHQNDKKPLFLKKTHGIEFKVFASESNQESKKEVFFSPEDEPIIKILQIFRDPEEENYYLVFFNDFNPFNVTQSIFTDNPLIGLNELFEMLSLINGKKAGCEFNLDELHSRDVRFFRFSATQTTDLPFEVLKPENPVLDEPKFPEYKTFQPVNVLNLMPAPPATSEELILGLRSKFGLSSIVFTYSNPIKVSVSNGIKLMPPKVELPAETPFTIVGINTLITSHKIYINLLDSELEQRLVVNDPTLGINLFSQFQPPQGLDVTQAYLKDLSYTNSTVARETNGFVYLLEVYLEDIELQHLKYG